ncbi:MAG: hypothetical protein ACPG7F_06425, partial [Aggregatilineales bacterium]
SNEPNFSDVTNEVNSRLFGDMPTDPNSDLPAPYNGFTRASRDTYLDKLKAGVKLFEQDMENENVLQRIAKQAETNRDTLLAEITRLESIPEADLAQNEWDIQRYHEKLQSEEIRAVSEAKLQRQQQAKNKLDAVLAQTNNGTPLRQGALRTVMSNALSQDNTGLFDEGNRPYRIVNHEGIDYRVTALDSGGYTVIEE